MEWTKIPTSLIISRTPDKDLLAITKYQLLWAELEHQPDDSVALRYMTSKQLATARQYIGAIMASVSADIDCVISQRGRRRKNYLKNKDNSKNVTVTRTGTVTGTRTGTVLKQIRLDKIRLDNINNNTSTPLAASAEKVSKPKKKTALQVFCNCVVSNFEEKGSVETDEQKRIWFKRNCRVLSDILNFCEKDIERALFTIDETCKWLDENNLEGGYEAVSRHLPEMHAKALKRINNGEHWNFTKEQKNQIDELYGKRAENITTEQAENNKKEFAKMIGGLVGGKL